MSSDLVKHHSVGIVANIVNISDMGRLRGENNRLKFVLLIMAVCSAIKFRQRHSMRKLMQILQFFIYLCKFKQSFAMFYGFNPKSE